MVSEGTLALLSACNFLFKGKELAIARDQIRMTIGCLKALGEVWPRTAKNVQEIQTITRHVLGLGSKTAKSDNVLGCSDVPSLSSDQGQTMSQSEADTSASDSEIFASLGSMEDICGWYSSSELSQDLTWWAGNPT